MTYILVNKSKSTQKEELDKLLRKIYGKDISQSPDIHFLDPFEKNSIGIEEIKEFQKTMIFKPFQEDIQVGVILQAEKLTHQAQNALLKTLEDSSSYSVFILCVDNEKNLLPTIRSRGKVIYTMRSTILEDTNDIEDIVGIDLIEQFNIIEKYAKEKNSSLELINSVEETYRKRLELDIKNGNIESSKKNMEDLKIIQKSREKINANCNRRLTLEAMIVLLEA